MSQKVSISPWPSTLNTPSWSKDGDIAIAVGESVQILTPKLRSNQDSIAEKAEKGIEWDHVHVRVNVFTEDEFPIPEAADFQTWSIGEEISLITATSVAWSSPGIARYRRCALGVLTSNHILSIWSAGVRTNASAQWKRRLTVNDAIKPHSTSHPIAGKQEQRIRAFAFSHPLRYESSHLPDPTMGWGHQLITVVNGVGEIFVLLIKSPFNTAPAPYIWSNMILARFLPEVYSPFEQGVSSSILSDYLDSPKYPKTLTWSPWVGRGDEAHTSFLAFRSKDIRYCRLQCSYESNEFALKVQINDETVVEDTCTYNGPDLWLLQLVDESYLVLCCFLEDSVNFYKISSKDASYSKSSKIKTDNSWDVISGVTICQPSARTLSVYRTKHIYWSNIDSLCIALSLPSLQGTKAETSFWEKDLSTELSHFQKEYSLLNAPFARLWGLASSPSGNYICACYSLHPSGMIEYKIPAEETCFLRITPAKSMTEGLHMPLTSKTGLCNDISTESIATEFRLWLKSQKLDDEHELLKIILEGLPVEEHSRVSVSSFTAKKQELQRSLLIDAKDEFYSDTTALQIVKLFRYAMRCKEGYMINRSKYLALSVLHKDYVPPLLYAQQLYSVVECALSLPRSRFRPSMLSQIILHHFMTACKDESLKDVNLSESAKLEICEICQSDIPFESAVWARCNLGHQHARCALTMVAIQIPGISKFCGICGKQYLRDEYSYTSIKQTMSESRTVGLNSADIKSLDFSFADLLFAACDTCIYCGGMKQPAVSKIRPLELSQPKAGSPTIVKAPESPAKSIHLEMDQDCQSEDPSMRTTDFFDSTSDIMQSEQAVPGGISLKRHSVGSSVQGLYNGNQGHSPHLKHTGEYSSESSKLKQYMELNYGLDSSSVSQIAPTPHSLDERATEIPVPEIRPLSINFSGAGRASSNTTSKAAQNIDEQYMTSRSNEDNQILGAHVITLQALMRDKDSLASSSARLSKPLQDPLDFKELRQSFLTKPPKRVKMVPPPVTLTTPTSHSPIEIQRTPYPFMYRKHFPPMSPVSENSDDTISQESVLSVYLRRNNANRPVKVSRMVLPMSASLKSPNLNNAKDNEKHFRTLDFDDSLFFRQLRTEYRKLRGPLRFLSAQTLQRITVEYFGRRSDRPVRCGGCDHAESEAMRSPRLLAFKGLADTFSEEKLMEHYRNPRAGKARYSWVHWAHRLAASTAPPFSSPLPYTRDPGTAGQDGEGALPTGSTMTTEKTIDTETTGTRGIGHQRQEEEQEEENRVAAAYDPQAGENGGGGVGIEFIEDWSVARIVAALAFILLLAVAAALLWIFLGISPAGLSSGFRGAGVRVETGLVFGVFVSLLGLAGVLAWMGVSWLVT